ncbi:MAG: LamG domain-containing protein, partial [Planctomycetota bacterium]
YSDNNPLKAKLADVWKDQTDNGSTASISLEGIANQSLQLDYDNQQAPYFAETYRDFSPAKDFTANDSEILTLYLKGQSTNSADEFYCTLVDSSDNTATQRITDPNTLVLPDWKKIYFAVNQFEQIDLSQIKRLIIGIGADSPSGPQSGTGTIWVDEFYLSQMICNDNQLAGDFDNNCKVNLSDFSQIASQWMEQYYVLPIPVDPGSQNLTAKWSFDESTDTMAADSTGNGHDGTLVDASWAPGSGTDGGGVSIDRASSTSSRVEIPTAAIPLSQGTYSAWVNLYEDQTSSVRYIFGHTTIPAWANRIQFYMDSSDTSLDLGLGASHRSSTAIMTLQTLVWHHIALTWDGSNYQVYVDGVLKASGAYSGLSELQSVTHIGNNGSDSPTEAFNGLIDEVSIYETVLTPEEILYLADAVPMVVNPRRTDLYTDGIIDLKDLSLFIADWLDCALSPVEASFD